MTREDIDNLKKRWLADPCWNIEESPGLTKRQRAELLDFRQIQEGIWEKVRQAELLMAAKRYGFEGNEQAARTIQNILCRLETAAEQISELEARLEAAQDFTYHLLDRIRDLEAEI